jgi:two-component system sensor histidine kinase DesK
MHAVFGKLRNSHLSWVPLVSLIYIAFIFVDPIREHASWKQWAWLIAGVLCFAVLYIVAWLRRDSSARWCALGIVVLALIYTPFDVAAYVYFTYAGVLLGFAFDIRNAYKSLALLLTIEALQMLGLNRTGWQLAGPLCATAIITIGNIHSAAKARADIRLRLSKDEVEHVAKMAERERIARDLHDLLGHSLSVIILKSELAKRVAGDDPVRASREIGEVEQIARGALAEVRQAIRGYRTRRLAEEMAHARATLETAGVRSECDVIGEANTVAASLSPEQETVLALALREAVTNVVRHADASVCRIRFSRSDNVFRLEVEDDGKGGVFEEGNGLQGMRERVMTLNGDIWQNLSRGTKLTIVLPAQST